MNFPLETPSRVLRRIQDLEDQVDELPTLPEMLSFVDSNASIQTYEEESSNSGPENILNGLDTSVKHRQQAHQQQHQQPLANSTNNRGNSTAISTNSTVFTSTPAPSQSNYYKSQSTIAAPSSVASSATVSQQQQQQRHPSFPPRDFDGHDDASSIGRAESLDEERDEMVVLSGSGSGEEVDGNSSVVHHKDDEDEDQGNSTSSSAAERALNAFFEEDDHFIQQEKENTTANLPPLPPSPIEQATPNSREYTVPLAGGDSPSSAEVERRLSSSNVVFQRRKSHRRTLSATSFAGEAIHEKEESTEEQNSAVGAQEDEDVEVEVVEQEEARVVGKGKKKQARVVFSPLRELNSNTTLSTPGVGRRAPTPRSPVTPLSNAGVSPSTSEHFTTPHAVLNKTDAERRKEHVLQTLKSTRFVALRGTPHPHRRGKPEAPSSPQQEGTSQDDAHSITSESTTDLTTFHRGNSSLPLAGVGEGAPTTTTRFNGAKLNAYLHSLNTHLTEENQSLVKVLGEREGEVGRLRKEMQGLEDRVREMSVRQEESSSVSASRSRSAEENEELHDRIGEQEREIEDLRRQLADAEQSHVDSSTAHEKELASLHARADELLADLEGKDGEIDAVRQELEGALQQQEADFEDKMRRLEEELSNVMTGQEEALAKATKELEERQTEEREEREEDQRRMEELEERCGKLEEERDALEREVEAAGSDAERQANERVKTLRQEVAGLSSTMADKDAEIERLGAVIEDLEARAEELDVKVAELEAAAASGSSHDDSELEAQLREKDENLKQMEEALDESARQLLQNEDDLEALRKDLVSERSVNASLSAQISQLSLHKTKAKSPLANEAFKEEQDPQVAVLEEALELANDEIARLTKQLTSSDRHAIEIKDIEIKTLERQKGELESRVSSLRNQVSDNLSFTPSKTPEKSFLFRPVSGVPTPKTPGQFLSNLSAWSPGNVTGADSTISPLLAQIQELELIVHKLQSQLAEANDDIDSKLDKLDLAGSGTISLARQLAEARERIALLEAELDRLTGENGTLYRVRTKLSTVSCPGCHETFDANKYVQLNIDKASRTVSLADSSTDPSQPLRDALTAVNKQLYDLRAERSTLSRQHTALQRDFDKARVDIARLEAELRAERERARSLGSETAQASREKAALESRLSTTESELRAVKREQVNATGPEAVERLRKEKSDLVQERTTLLHKLAAANERLARVDRDLASSKSVQLDAQTQLERHTVEVQRLREALEAKDSERTDILRGVASLQADLNRVRQDAVSLGVDLSNVQKGRDHPPAQDSAELVRLGDELAKAKRRLGVFEQKVAEHVCPSDANALVEMKARHADEAKGLLVMIKYLKLRVTREATFRTDLSHQKGYLSAIVDQKQSTIDATFDTLSQLGLPYRPPSQYRARLTFKVAAKAVLAAARMSLLAKRWKQANVGKIKLRTQAYPETRGRPFLG
ncbi:hypothetical protein T439DRAFT_327161 [Meredithblackwellia eburnea MCA 4105]